MNHNEDLLFESTIQKSNQTIINIRRKKKTSFFETRVTLTLQNKEFIL